MKFIAESLSEAAVMLCPFGCYGFVILRYGLLYVGRQQRVWRPSYVWFGDRRTRCWRPSNNEQKHTNMQTSARQYVNNKM